MTKIPLMLFSLFFSVISLSLCTRVDPILAQMIPDRTLGRDNSQVRQVNQFKSLIEGGAIRGDNLFHSFLEFNVKNGQSAYFANPSDINNILTRVTGGNVSQIFGTLGVNGNANLFLLNPNGFIFGKDANLDLNGSFTATTGEIDLGANGIFSLNNIPQGNLLNISPQARFNNASGQITNQASLVVKQGQNLVLMADQIENQGNIVAPNGLIQLQGNQVNVANNSVLDVSSNQGLGQISIQENNSFVSINNTPTLANSRLQADTTLGNENSIVTNVNTNRDRITGGASRGISLFHSFLDFNVENNKEVYFANPIGIENIVTRLTGNNTSEIRGTLGVEGSADLYFINPNGLFFNQNASLDLNGSFFASTAEAIAFDEFVYRSINPNIPPSLVESNPSELRVENNSGDITLQLENNVSGNLSVNPLQTLALIGGNVTIDGISMISPRSNLIFGGLNQAGVVEINSNLSLNFPTGIRRSDISIANFAFINVTGSDRGSVNITGDDIAIESSLIFAGIAEEQGFINAQAGDITFDATDNLSVTNNSFIFNDLNLNSVGNSGRVIINAPNILVDNSSITTDMAGNGSTGGITIDTDILSLQNGGRLSANNDGQGNTQLIKIKANDSINIDGENIFALPSQITSRVNPNGQGNSGGIIVETKNLTLTKGGIIDASTFGQGDSGRIKIQATGNIILDGEDSSGFPSAILSQINTLGKANSGGITIDTHNLSLSKGTEISATTFGQGDAGLIEINATQNITIDGETSDGSFPSRIISTVQPDAIGNSKGVVINTANLTLSNGGQISGSTGGKGDAGLVQITATKDISIDGEDSSAFASGIFSSVALEEAIGDSDGIMINSSNLNLTNGGTINASTIGQGNAGIVQIKASEGIIVDGETSDGIASGIGSQVGQATAIGNSGGVKIETSTLSITNGGRVNASTFGKGDAGLIQVKVIEDITIDGENSEGFLSGITSLVNPDAQGDSDGILIDTTTLTLRNGGEISASTFGQGNAGLVNVLAKEKITIDGENSNAFSTAIASTVEANAIGNSGGIILEAKNLSLSNGGEISASTIGDGNTGLIDLNVKEDLIIDGRKSNGASSRILSSVIIDAIGDSLGIKIATTNLSLNNGGQISASTFGQGDAGDMNIIVQEDINVNRGFIDASTFGEGDAGDIDITANKSITISDTFLSIIFNQEVGGISALTFTDGNAGDIEIKTPQLRILGNAQIQAVTQGEGTAGNIKLKLQDSLLIDGQQTGIFADTGDISTGNGGEIAIDTKTVNLTDGATIGVNSQGEGIGGNVDLRTAQLSLDNSQISARTLSTDGGNIFINAQDVITLQNSFISATAGTAQAGGDGGNIKIESPFIIAFPENLNAITANAFSGDGGSIDITTNAIFGNEFLVISASSQFGLDGEVVINDPDIDPSDGLIIIEPNFIDVETLIAQNPCAELSFAEGKGSEFIILGRGGLPAQSFDLLDKSIILTPWLDFSPDTSPIINQENSDSRVWRSTQLKLSSSGICQWHN